MYEPNIRTVIVVDKGLPIGRAANAAAILAISLGAAHPGMPGPDLVDGGGRRHPGLFPDGLPILAGKAKEIARLHDEVAAIPEVHLIAMPAAGQGTVDYDELRGLVARTAPGELAWAGIAIRGPWVVVRGLTKRLSLLR